MLDLGNSFHSSVERDPDALAIACQFAGIVITPINWQSKADEIDYYVENSEANAIIFEEVSAGALRESHAAKSRKRIALGAARGDEIKFETLLKRETADTKPRVGADAWSVMLYTSGTTAKPKGVPRRQRAERAAAVTHVAPNRYAHGERTRRRVRLPAIAPEKVTNLYLVPTLCHDLVYNDRFAIAGASMTDGLLKELNAAFKPDLFVNHYGSSEIYTFTIDQKAPAKPGSTGRAGINQRIRVSIFPAAATSKASWRPRPSTCPCRRSRGSARAFVPAARRSRFPTRSGNRKPARFQTRRRSNSCDWLGIGDAFVAMPQSSHGKRPSKFKGT